MATRHSLPEERNDRRRRSQLVRETRKCVAQPVSSKQVDKPFAERAMLVECPTDSGNKRCKIFRLIEPVSNAIEGLGVLLAPGWQ